MFSNFTLLRVVLSALCVYVIAPFTGNLEIQQMACKSLKKWPFHCQSGSHCRYAHSPWSVIEFVGYCTEYNH